MKRKRMKKTQKRFVFDTRHRTNGFRKRYPEFMVEETQSRMPRGGNILVRLYDEAISARAISEAKRENIYEYLELHPHLRDAFNLYCDDKPNIKFEEFLRQYKTRPPLFSKYGGLRLVVDNSRTA